MAHVQLTTTSYNSRKHQKRGLCTLGCVIKIKIANFFIYLVFDGAFWDPFQFFFNEVFYLHFVAFSFLGHLITLKNKLAPILGFYMSKEAYLKNTRQMVKVRVQSNYSLKSYGQKNLQKTANF